MKTKCIFLAIPAIVSFPTILVLLFIQSFGSNFSFETILNSEFLLSLQLYTGMSIFFGLPIGALLAVFFYFTKKQIPDWLKSLMVVLIGYIFVHIAFILSTCSIGIGGGVKCGPYLDLYGKLALVCGMMSAYYAFVLALLPARYNLPKKRKGQMIILLLAALAVSALVIYLQQPTDSIRY